MIGSIYGPREHRPCALHIKSHYLLASYYGSKARLCLYDLRYKPKILYQRDLLNDHYQELKFTVSADGKYVACPNQFGTIRVFEYDNLAQIVDLLSDPVSKHSPYFMPYCQFSDAGYLYYNTKDTLIRAG